MEEKEQEINEHHDEDFEGQQQDQPVDPSSSSSSPHEKCELGLSIIVPSSLPPHFEDMNLRQFSRYCVKQPTVLRESMLMLPENNMKHPSWGDTSVHASGRSTRVFLVILLTMILLCSIAVGLSVGLTQSTPTWGVVSAVLAIVVSFGMSFAVLLTYMACYGQGLQRPPMPTWISRWGYVCNMRANILCRYIMTCCFRPHLTCCVDAIMNGEASARFKHIQSLNNGQGPPPHSIFWLGDSEFTFWHCLSDDMRPYNNNKSTHVNAGFGGSRICDIQRHVHQLCLDWDPKIVMVHASGNDYDFGQGKMSAREIMVELITLLETIARHDSVQSIGYLLSSRRPTYDDSKWTFMVRVHTLTIQAISQSSLLRDVVKILDLRDNIHPLDDFVSVDRVHLNDVGHKKKSKILLKKMKAIWPNKVNGEENGDHDDDDDDV